MAFPLWTLWVIAKTAIFTSERDDVHPAPSVQGSPGVSKLIRVNQQDYYIRYSRKMIKLALKDWTEVCSQAQGYCWTYFEQL